jgi:hypothetical protein
MTAEHIQPAGHAARTKAGHPVITVSRLMNKGLSNGDYLHCLLTGDDG